LKISSWNVGVGLGEAGLPAEFQDAVVQPN